MRRKREERRRKNGGLRQLTPTHKAQDECCYLLACVLSVRVCEFAVCFGEENEKMSCLINRKPDHHQLEKFTFHSAVVLV